MVPSWILFAAGLSVALATYLLATAGRPALATRYERYVQASVPSHATHPEAPAAWRAMAEVLARPLLKVLPASLLEPVRARLKQAGFAGPGPLQLFVVIQLAMLLVGLAVGSWAASRFGPGALALGGLGGAMLPWLVITRLARTRQRAIEAALPDTADLLTVCVEAGLGLDAAIAQMVTRQSPGCAAINQEFDRYLRELQMGVGRPEALKALGTRSGVEDLSHLVSALIQGDALGGGVGPSLRSQSQHLRLRRRQRAEETAMKAPVKIVFPLVFCIFPALFVIVLGPAGLRLMDHFSH